MKTQTNNLSINLTEPFLVKNLLPLELELYAKGNNGIPTICYQRQTPDEINMLSLIAEQTTNSVIITDKEQRITWVNKAFCDLTEYTVNEVLGKRPGNLLQGAATNEKTLAYLRRQIQNAEGFHCEILNYSKSGKTYWTELNGQPVFGENGEVKQFFAIQTNINERKKIEEERSLSEKHYKMLFLESPVPKWIFCYSTLQFTDVNMAALKLYGYTREEFLTLTPVDLRPDKDRKKIKKIINELGEKEGLRYKGFMLHKTKDGRILNVEITTHGIMQAKGLMILAVCQNITNQVELKKMVSLEKINAHYKISKAIITTQEKERKNLGAELHDNINQLLATAKLYIENIGYFPDEKEDFIKKSAGLLQNAIDEIRAVSKQLVVPCTKEKTYEVLIEELVDNYKKLNLFDIEAEIAAGYFVIDNEFGLTLFRIIQEQLNNIVKYAGATAVRILIKQNKSGLLLQISDNGIGFDKKQQRKGVGLYNIKNRAELYRGKLEIQTEPNKGCLLHIAFPLNRK